MLPDSVRANISGLLEHRCRPRLPCLDQASAPLHEVVHVLVQLWPSDHTRRSVRSNECWALALRLRAHLLAHVLASPRQLVLQLRALPEIHGGARLACLSTLRPKRSNPFLQRRRHLLPAQHLLVGPLAKAVHVLEELRPSHLAGGGVWRDECGAVALRVCAHLLAHVLAGPCQLVLELDTILEVLRLASALLLRVPVMDNCCCWRSDDDSCEDYGKLHCVAPRTRLRHGVL